MQAALELEGRLLDLRASATPLSEHTHLLVSLQRCFGRWMHSLRPDPTGVPSDEEQQLRLARALRAIAKRLHAHLRSKHEEGLARARRAHAAAEDDDPTAGDEIDHIDAPVPSTAPARAAAEAAAAVGVWAEAEVKDHSTVLPSLLRFLHGLMVDYHATFHGSGIELNREVLREVVASYYEMHAIAVLFERPARFGASACLITAAELQRKRDDAAADAEEAARHATRARQKLDDTIGWIDRDAAAAKAQGMVTRDAAWARSQPEFLEVLRKAYLTADALDAEGASTHAAAAAAAAPAATAPAAALAAGGTGAEVTRVTSDELLAASAGAAAPAAAPAAASAGGSAPSAAPERRESLAPERVAATDYFASNAGAGAPAAGAAGAYLASGAPSGSDERMLRYQSLVLEGEEAVAEAQAGELKRRGLHFNEKTSDFAMAMRMFEGAYALLPQASTLVSVANMALKLGQV